MVKLLYYCVELSQEKAYLTINMFDIIFALIRSNILGFHLTQTFTKIHPNVQLVLELILLVFAVASIIIYFNRKVYNTQFHKIYAIARTFLSILYSVIVFWAFFDFLLYAETNRSDFGRYLVQYIVLVLLQFIDLFWSYILVNIIHVVNQF